jgi:hypothetical protein
VRLEDLYHVVAAAAQIVGEEEFVIVGSQSILGSYPDAPESLLRSQEADIYPRNAPDKAINIEGVLGDGSYFQQTFGYYAHAVGARNGYGADRMGRPPSGCRGPSARRQHDQGCRVLPGATRSHPVQARR